MIVSVGAYPNLVLLSDSRFSFTYTDSKPQTFPIEIIVPPNDTGLLSVSLVDMGWHLKMGSKQRYFVSDESSVRVFDHNPRPVRDYEMEALKRERDSARAVRDSINAARRIGPPHPWDGWSGPLVIGHDSLGNETWDSIASEQLKQGIEPKRQVTPPPPPLPRDSVEKLIKARQQESLERARQVQVARQNEKHPDRGGTPREQMERFIQQNPMAKAVEFVADGPTLWVRREGDSVFTNSTPISDRAAYREEKIKRSAKKSESGQP